MSTYTILGQVQDRNTQKGVSSLKIEAWDKDLLFDDFVGSAVTDESGHFEISFSEAHFQELFLDQQPDLFFKIYRGAKLICSTENSVLWNVQEGDTPMIIEVDLPNQEESTVLIVKGLVRREDKAPLCNAVVRAVDKDLRSEQPLGQTRTDDEGRYEIRYTREQFRRAEKRSADLIVRAFDPETGSLLLAESEVIFNARSVEVVDLVVTRTFSEYERYLATLEPVREKVPVAELTADDIAFLSHETGIAAKHIEFLTIASRLGKETELPAALFYGLFRQGLPTALSDLLEQESEAVREALEKSLDHHLIPARLRENLDSNLERLIQLRETDPGVQGKQRKDRLRRLGRIIDLPEAKMESVVSRAASPSLVTDKLLSSMVEAGDLQETEAKALGLTVNLYQLCGSDETLTHAVKNAHSGRLPQGTIQRLDDLAVLDQDDWLQILEQAGTEPPKGYTRQGYAFLLAKKIENLFPSKVMLQLVTAGATDGLAQGLESLQPLFEVNDTLFGGRPFGAVTLPDVDPENTESLRQAYVGLTILANTYPGLQLTEILDDRQLSVAEKQQMVDGRIALLTRFHAQNPDKEFLFLDYAPDSADLQGLSFSGFSADEQRMVLKTVKAYQRLYSVTRDATHTKLLIGQGNHSAFSIANMNIEELQDSTGLEERIIAQYQKSANQIAVKNALGTFGMYSSALGPWASIDNTDYHSLSEYLRKINGWEALFGNLDYCKCEHCRSIFSPAAYFVDLMRFLEKNVRFSEVGGGDHVAWESDSPFKMNEDKPLHLRRRRPDLWNLPLTCENTNQLIPYLDIINEALENDIYLRMGHTANDLPVVGRDRSTVEDEVYAALGEARQSFRQPFSLGLERLGTYLGHFDAAREDIARALEEPVDVITAAALNLSQAECELITEANDDLAHLSAVYGLQFAPDFAPELDLVGLGYPDPARAPEDDDYEASINNVQPLLKAMGLSRTELGALIKTEFVRSEYYQWSSLAGEEDFRIQGEKRIPEGEDASVQNDIERIRGLSERGLDRMHRFVRMWRHLPWTVKELDLVLKKLSDRTASNNLTATTLQHLAEIRSIQRRFALTAEQITALWGFLPREAFVDGQQSLVNRLFNLPDFVKLDGKWPEAAESLSFLHPAFRIGPPPTPEVDYVLHRMRAGLRVDDDQLLELIVGLSEPLGVHLASEDPEDKRFHLSTSAAPPNLANLALLYRHARLAEALDLSIPELFQLLRLAPAIGDDHVNALSDITALVEFYDWWKSTDYTLDDIAAVVVGTATTTAAQAIARKLVKKVRSDGALIFSHSIFAFLEGVTEEQSQNIIAANTGAIVEVLGSGFRVARAYGPNMPIRIPEGMDIGEEGEEALRAVLDAAASAGTTFNDSFFVGIAGLTLTEVESRALVSENLGFFDKAPSARYRVAEGFAEGSVITPPELPEQPISASGAELAACLMTYRTDSFPVFDDTLFTAVEGVSEEQSRAIVAAYPQWIIPAPLENAYWLTPSSSARSLVIPDEPAIPITESAANGLLSTYRATDVLPNLLASELGCSAEKIDALVKLTGVDLAEPTYNEALKGQTTDDPIVALVDALLPLTVLFKDDVFDQGALGYVAADLDRFELADLSAVGMEAVRRVAIFRQLLGQVDELELDRQTLFQLLSAFLPSAGKFYRTETTATDKQEIQ